jgi:ATP synthase protein I
VPAPSDRERRPPKEDGLSGLADAYRKAAPYMAASTTLIAAMLVFMALGYWLDRKLGHRIPWLLLLGAAIGMTGGFIGFFRTVLRAGGKK